MNELTNETLMTKKDVAEYLDCCRATVDKLFLLPDFPKIMIGKKKSYVKFGDFCRYLENFRGKKIDIKGDTYGN